MKRAILLISAMLVIPALAEDLPSIHDGPTAIKPLTVIPKGPEPKKVCDFEHNCWPEKGGPPIAVKPAPLPAIVPVKPIPPAPPPAPLPVNTWKEEAIVTRWKNCMAQALKEYNNPPHSLSALQVSSAQCEYALQPASNPPPQVMTASPMRDGRRNLGCGWWPIGSDADRACENGTF